MKEPTSRPGMSDALANLRQALQALATAADTATLRLVLSDYPGLLQPGMDDWLTRRVQESWDRDDKATTCIFVACRSLLARCRSEGVQAVLAHPLALPIPRSGALGQLLLSGSEQVDLSRRTTLARCALAEVRRASEPDLWAVLQCELADCLAQSQAPDRVEHLEEALSCYQAALQVWNNPPYAGSPKWAQTLHDMATTLLRRIRGRRSDNVQRAIELYQQALTVRTQAKHPLEWAETLQNMGNAWMEMPAESQTDNIHKAIECYRAALAVRTRQARPDLWAETTYNLALAYRVYPGKDRAQNVEQATQLLEDVLLVRSPGKHPLELGRTRVALGNAYVTRLQNDRTANLERAIDHYQKALEVLAREVHPAEWAQAHYDLAVAYGLRPAGEREHNLRQAIHHYQQSLEVYASGAYPIEWAHVQTGLGNTFCQPEIGDRASSLEQAIACYQAALTVRTRENDPQGWATVQNNLGNAYADRISGQKANNQEQAIVCYQNALQIRTRDAAAARWAETMNNLGAVYSERLRGDPAQNRNRATDYLRQALEIHEPRVFPNDSRRAARNLAHLLFAQQDWAEAARYYTIALEATEQLYQACATPTARQVELHEARDLPACAAYCLARNKNPSKAVQVLEQGRARALGEALARNEAALDSASPADHGAFADVRARIAALEAQARAIDQPNSRDFVAVSDDLRQARADLDAIVARIRQGQPEFMPIGLDSTGIVSVARAVGQPLVYLLTTPYGSLALVVPPDAKPSAVPHAIWIDRFKTDDLNAILYGRQGQIGYLQAVVGTDIQALKQVLGEIWTSLETGLTGPIATGLDKLGFSRVVLVPIGMLGLLPLSTASLESVTRVPSARALQTALTAAQERAKGTRLLLGVGNPQPNPTPLPFAQIEVQEIEAYFKPGERRTFYGYRATRAAIQQALPDATHLHLACHATFRMPSPLDSTLYFSGEDTWTLRDLLDGGLNLSTIRLAVLSACQTGITDFKHVPDEVVGFPAGLMQARVPNVISTLWPVADISTALLLSRFYRHHLQDGLAPAVALNKAQGWLRRATAKEMALADYYERRYRESRETDSDAFQAMRYYRARPDQIPFDHPYFWAAFVISGASI